MLRAAVAPSAFNSVFPPCSSTIRIRWRFNVGRLFLFGCTSETWQHRKLAHLLSTELDVGETPRGFFQITRGDFFFSISKVELKTKQKLWLLNRPLLGVLEEGRD